MIRLNALGRFKKNNLRLFPLLILTVLFSQNVLPQYYFFGRNKVQYAEFEWKVIKTDHFDIYYYAEMEEIAEIGAYYAEEAFVELKAKFENLPLNRIPLIFYNTHIHFQQTNTTPGFIPEGVGGFFEFFKGRVVVPFLGSLPEFRRVIRHELIHVFTMNLIYRIHKDRRAASQNSPPLWFIEGIAEYWSTGWDAQAEMVLRDAVMNLYNRGLKDIWQIEGTFLMYKLGQNFFYFLSEKYGEDKILALIKNLWQFRDFEKNLEYTLNSTIEGIDRAWKYYLQKKYYPLVLDKTPLSVYGEKITKKGFYFSPSIFEQKGEKFAVFIANIDGYSSIYKASLEKKQGEKTADFELILRGERENAFEAFHLLTPSLSVSKEGIIAFIVKSGPTDALYFYSITDNRILNKFVSENLIALSSPKWSNFGDYIVFSAIDKKGYSDIYILNYKTLETSRITNDYYTDIDPVFGPGDSTLIFSSNRIGGKFEKLFNLFEFNLVDKSISPITCAGYNFKTPVFYPKLNKTLFTCDHGGVFNIWELIRDERGSSIGAKKVTSYMTSIYGFEFIDSTSLILSAFENFSFQLYKHKYNAENDSGAIVISFEFDKFDEEWKENKIILDSYADKYKYEKEYALDYAQSQISTDPIYGTRGGAFISLSDILGDDQYYLLIYNTAEVQSDLLKSFNVAFSKLNFQKRTNYSFGVFHFSGRRYDMRDKDEFYFERSFGGYLTFYYPLSVFQRIEYSTTVANSDKEIISGFIERKALLFSNSISFVSDNSLWSPTGPIDGERFRAGAAYTLDVKYNNVNFYSFIFDYRKYIRLSLRSALAFRGSLYYNNGEEARRYIAGGSWDLRGWPRWSLRGEKLWVSSLELRFPLVDIVAVQFPFVGMWFQNIRGALFFDAGGVWDKVYDKTLGSVGFGLRYNLFNMIVFRYDMGKKIENNFSDLQKGLFYQFFFGWDF